MIYEVWGEIKNSPPEKFGCFSTEKEAKQFLPKLIKSLGKHKFYIKIIK
jgi:hypothetical protein